MLIVVTNHSNNGTEVNETERDANGHTQHRLFHQNNHKLHVSIRKVVIRLTDSVHLPNKHTRLRNLVTRNNNCNSHNCVSRKLRSTRDTALWTK
jgi:hypothetical protein